MAVFRMFYTNFWRDAFVVDLTPEERYLYIYIMTNPNTNQCGIYQIPKRTMSFETGFSIEKIDMLLNKLKDYGYVDYCEQYKEIMILNWIRENFINSPNNIKSMNKELRKVGNKNFIQKFYNICLEEDYPLDKLFTDLIDTSTPFGKLIKLFEDNIHPITAVEYIKLSNWAQSIDPEAIEIAIHEAVNHNARTMNYINGILDNWNSLNLRTKSDETIQRYIQIFKIRS